MFCTKCGKKLEEDAIFCVACGNRIEQDDHVGKQKQENPEEEMKEQTVCADAEESEKAVTQPKVSEPKQPKEKKKISKKLVTLLVIIGAVILTVIMAVSVWNRPVAKINRALQDRDLFLATDIVMENDYSVKLNEKTDKLITEITDETMAGYNEGKLTYDEAYMTLDNLLLIGGESQETKDHVYTVRNEISEKHSLDVDLSEAKDALNSGDGYAAMQAYNEILDEHKDNKEAQEGYEQAQKDYLDSFLESAWKYANEGAYTDAQYVLDDAVTALGEIAEIQKARDEIENKRVSGMLDEVYAYADSGNWETALDLLDTYEEENPGETIFHDTRAEIMAKMPITLKNIITISSDRIEVEEDVIYDKYGNYYDGAVMLDAYYEGYGLYNLDKKYTKFTGTVFMHKQMQIGNKLNFSVYLDDELVYHSGVLTEESAPSLLELDVTDASTMRIVTGYEERNYWAYICFGNTSFEKVPVTAQ